MKSVKQKVPGCTDLNWCWYRLGEMDPALLYDLLALRVDIFVVEQACVYRELDGLDKVAKHLLITRGEEAVACLRVLPPGPGESSARIGRVAVSIDWRKFGLARLMVKNAIEEIGLKYPSGGICLDAQTYLKEFYLSLGFKVCGEDFLEDGIPHIPMKM
jgi:ElaA protein